MTVTGAAGYTSFSSTRSKCGSTSTTESLFFVGNRPPSPGMGLSPPDWKQREMDGMARMMHRIVYCHLQQIQEMEKPAKSAPGNGNSAETIEGDCGKERGRGNNKTLVKSLAILNTAIREGGRYASINVLRWMVLSDLPFFCTVRVANDVAKRPFCHLPPFPGCIGCLWPNHASSRVRPDVEFQARQLCSQRNTNRERRRNVHHRSR